MRIVPVDIAVLAEEIGRRFALGPITERQLWNTDGILKLLYAHDPAKGGDGALDMKSAYFQYIDQVPDEDVLASGADERFWSNASFLMLSEFESESERFQDRALRVEGPTTPDEFLRCYYAEVRGRIFDIDVIMLGCTTSQLLIVTHYGVVVLFEPKRGTAEGTTSGGDTGPPHGG